MRTLFLAPACLAIALPAFGGSFDLKISTSVANAELNDALQRASLLVPLARDEDVNGQDIVAAAQAEYGRLIGALYDQGYFAPVIEIRLDGREAATLSPLAVPSSIRRATVNIDAGSRFVFGQTSLTPVTGETKLPDAFRTGQQAGTSPIQDAVEAGIEGWRAVGHAKARVANQRIVARHKEARLDVGVMLDPGPRLRFGPLRISGNQAVRTNRIIDIAGLPEGKVFDPKELNRVTTRLRRAGTFQVAAISEADTIGPDGTLPIDLQIVEEKPRRFGFGAEISTTDGLNIGGFWLHRNLFGGAERLRVEGGIGGIGGQTGGADFKIGARYSRPATFNEDTDFFALTEIESLDEESFSADRVKLEAGIRRYASEKREFTFGAGLEHARTKDAFGDREYTIFTLPMSAEFDDRNSELDSTEGFYGFISVTPFAAIEGTESGLRTYADLRGYRQLGERLTFAARVQLGSVAGPDVSTAPADFLFYSGGGGTVRGQDYQSLGVTLPSGEEVGGRSFLGLSAELRMKATDSLSVVGFYDAGYIGTEAFPNGAEGDWQSGAGLGLRYDTGIGPLRLDLGIPVSGPGDQSGFEIYIGIGQAF